MIVVFIYGKFLYFAVTGFHSIALLDFPEVINPFLNNWNSDCVILFVRDLGTEKYEKRFFFFFAVANTALQAGLGLN